MSRSRYVHGSSSSKVRPDHACTAPNKAKSRHIYNVSKTKGGMTQEHDMYATNRVTERDLRKQTRCAVRRETSANYEGRSNRIGRGLGKSEKEEKQPIERIIIHNEHRIDVQHVGA
jgi:hypothetical protein